MTQASSWFAALTVRDAYGTLTLIFYNLFKNIKNIYHILKKRMTKEENIKNYYRNKAIKKYQKEKQKEREETRKEIINEYIKNFYKKKSFEDYFEIIEEKKKVEKQKNIKDFYDKITFEKHEPLREESKSTFGIYKNSWDRAFHNCFTRAKNFKGYISEFKKKMENNFEEGMCWDNYGEWEVDHVTPLARNGPHCVDNLQPMWKTENRHKWAKLDYANTNAKKAMLNVNNIDKFDSRIIFFP